MKSRMLSRICATHHASLEEVHLLQKAFHTAFDHACFSGIQADVQKAQQAKVVLETAVRELKATLLDWEKEVIKKHPDALVESMREKREKGEAFTRIELLFLYEIYAPFQTIERFPDFDVMGWRDERNHDEDALIVFDCTPEQIARDPTEIISSTVAYIGPITRTCPDPSTGRPILDPSFIDLFKRISSCEYRFTLFPDHRFYEDVCDVGGKTSKELQECFEKEVGKLPSKIKSLLENGELVVTPSSEEVKVIFLSPKDLGINYRSTTEEVLIRARALGLDYCPPDFGLYYLIHKQHELFQKISWGIHIGIDPVLTGGVVDLLTMRVVDAEGDFKPVLTFGVGSFMEPWDPGEVFVFRLPKSSHQKTVSEEKV